ncbi:hypothetical protein BHE74_00026784 [Ensete ventricosum]|nr:hypothetical protein BHE74_00026784 [Ensete ventricosum]RZR95076.1 hypothetical protein BHM03_00023884 [Ensete ventricosum]
MGLRPRKGHWVTLAAPLASLLVGGSPPAAMEPTSVPAPCGSRSPAGIAPYFFSRAPVEKFRSCYSFFGVQTDDPSSPQPLAGAGPSGDSLDLAQGPCAMALPHEGAVVSSKGLTTTPSNNLSVGSVAPSPRPFAPSTTFEQPAASSRVPSAQQLWEEAKAATAHYRGLLNSALVELVHPRLYAQELEQRLAEVREETNFQLHELDLEFNLALRRAEEAEARTEEAYDEATIIEDMVALSVTECERKVETLSCELKDAR